MGRLDSGYCRSGDHPLFAEGVFVQLIDPSHFAGSDVFRNEMQDLKDSICASRPTIGSNRPYTLGERSFTALRKAEEEGIAYDTGTLDLLGC